MKRQEGVANATTNISIIFVLFMTLSIKMGRGGRVQLNDSIFRIQNRLLFRRTKKLLEGVLHFFTTNMESEIEDLHPFLFIVQWDKIRFFFQKLT